MNTPHEGERHVMERMPSPSRAEENQRRKAAFIPIWPIVGAVVVVVLLVVFLH